MVVLEGRARRTFSLCAGIFVLGVCISLKVGTIIKSDFCRSRVLWEQKFGENNTTKGTISVENNLETSSLQIKHVTEDDKDL